MRSILVLEAQYGLSNREMLTYLELSENEYERLHYTDIYDLELRLIRRVALKFNMSIQAFIDFENEQQNAVNQDVKLKIEQYFNKNSVRTT